MELLSYSTSAPPWKWSLMTIAMVIQSIIAMPLREVEASIDKSPSHWVDIWTTMPQLVESYNLPPAPFNGSTGVFLNSTLRQTVQVGLDATEIRIRLSNAFGPNDLKVDKVVISLPQGQKAGTNTSDLNSTARVEFGTSPTITIPSGALAVSDPIAFPLAAQSILMIDIYLAAGQEGFSITGHPGSRTTSYLAAGDQTGVHYLSGDGVQETEHWYFISGIEAHLSHEAGAFVILGDSITDGKASITNANDRWPDLLLDRMRHHAATKKLAVANQAAGGNRVLHDGLGPSLVSRIDRDVLAQSGVTHVMLFEGVNDIGVAAPDRESQLYVGDQLMVAYQQIATRVHAAGLPLYGATITPFGTPSSSNYTQPYSSLEREKTRQRVNTFIRTSGVFDAVIDFDQAVRDPAEPSHLLAIYDSGDHLHPNEAGYHALADYFPLDVFNRVGPVWGSD
ncbi:hypothetical protein N7468_000798 [Penicillium chermesinum]|uniref:SGNH hydrolase-type esterase domain-containing protein n=1 Tax=Penicillium chermesinum TaxID=63820 RepID=A0A9W9TW53_9EURO|nr:uncharacterized protein N7468_000798 [Penicillium chermesinum]KAJ5245815.1 hypothetical protein N7468_000798 [Penicillium chermesinum]KAJ6144115.1 hypothetical protein N7470_008010 [Penicillium chermesinum]